MFVTSYSLYYTTCPFRKQVYFMRKEFAPWRSKFFPISVDIIQTGGKYVRIGLFVSRTCAIITNCHRNCHNYRLHSLLPRSPRNTEKSIACGWYSGTPAKCWSAPDSDTSLALYGVVYSTRFKNIFDEAVGSGPFTDEFRFTPFRPDSRRHINWRQGETSPTLALLRGIDFGAVLLWSREAFLMV